MSFIDALERLESNESRKGPGPRCIFERLTVDLDPSEYQRLTEVVDNPRIYATDIARTLTQQGYPVSGEQVLRHRRRSSGTGCRCPK